MPTMHVFSISHLAERLSIESSFAGRRCSFRECRRKADKAGRLGGGAQQVKWWVFAMIKKVYVCWQVSSCLWDKMLTEEINLISLTLYLHDFNCPLAKGAQLSSVRFTPDVSVSMSKKKSVLILAKVFKPEFHLEKKLVPSRYISCSV